MSAKVGVARKLGCQQHALTSLLVMRSLIRNKRCAFVSERASCVLANVCSALVFGFVFLWGFYVSCYFLLFIFYFCFLVVCFPVWERKNIKLVDREVGRIWEKSEKKKTNRNVLFEKFFSWKSLLTVSLSDCSPYYSSCARSDFKGCMVRLF